MLFNFYYKEHSLLLNFFSIANGLQDAYDSYDSKIQLIFVAHSLIQPHFLDTLYKFQSNIAFRFLVSVFKGGHMDRQPEKFILMAENSQDLQTLMDKVVKLVNFQ